MLAWPSDSIVIVAPPPGEAVLDDAEPTLPARCRHCDAEVLVRTSTIDCARKSPHRRGRPVSFFCITCAVQHDRPPILEDLRKGN